MNEQLLLAGLAAAVVTGVVLLVLALGRPRSPRGSRPSGPDPGGVFGGVPNIAPGLFNPGTAPPPTYEETENVRALDDRAKPTQDK